MRKRRLAFAIWLTTPSLQPLRWRKFAVVFLLTTGLIVVFMAFGLWYATWVTIGLGRSYGPTLRAMVAGGFAGLLGWALPLAWEQWRYGLAPTARSLAAIMGFSHQPAVPLILTCLVGLLIGLTGAWVGSAFRALIEDGQPAISR